MVDLDIAENTRPYSRQSDEASEEDEFDSDLLPEASLEADALSVLDPDVMSEKDDDEEEDDDDDKEDEEEV